MGSENLKPGLFDSKVSNVNWYTKLVVNATGGPASSGGRKYRTFTWNVSKTQREVQRQEKKIY